MTPSIRTFLLINLLLSVMLVTSLAIIGNLFLEHKDLRSHLDGQLTFTALTIQTLISDDLSANKISAIQKRIDQIPAFMENSYCGNEKNPHACIQKIRPFFEKIQFQIWNKDKKVILHSFKTPIKALHYRRIGFTDRVINNEPWRIFVTQDPITKVKIAVAERYAFRDQLEAQITQDSILIMIITAPLLGLLIWVVVGRGLASIRRVADEVRDRAASYLKPVDLEEVPPEIQPLVTELNSLFIRLQAAFQREKRFAADAAHELRTPLAALRAQAQVALNATEDTDRKSSLNKVLKCVDRSAHVVQQLLTLSRMVPESAIKEMATVALNKEAAQIIADLVPAARKKNITIELSAPEESVKVVGSATALGILIRNLVDNAIRYTPNGGTVKVVINSTRKHVKLRVIDNGPGIPEELRERVFERFFRVVGSKASGSGLGLGIVQQIVQIHKARIELASPKSGIGLEIIVTFAKPPKS